MKEETDKTSRKPLPEKNYRISSQGVRKSMRPAIERNKELIKRLAKS